MRWVISFPCWGDHHRAIGVDGPLQSALHALKYAGIENALFIVNTDDPRPFWPLLKDSGHEVRFYSVPNVPVDTLEKYSIFGAAHRQAIDLAGHGDMVALLCGDMTVSQEAFVAAAGHFQRGKRIVMAAASSTVGRAPITSARKLLEWSVDNLTPMCRDLFWKEGRGTFPWCVYFRHKNGIDFRGFHLHPFAVVKHDGLTFRGNTSDLSLSQEFPERLVHVVTSPDDMALVERSPADRRRPRLFKVRQWTVVSWAAAMGRHANERHLWHFAHQINLVGRPDPGNQAIAEKIVAKIERQWGRTVPRPPNPWADAA